MGHKIHGVAVSVTPDICQRKFTSPHFFWQKTLCLFVFSSTINNTVSQFHRGKNFTPVLVPLMPPNIDSGGGGGPNVLDVECCRAQCGDCVSAHVGEDIGDFTGFLLICLDRISHCLS